RSRFSWEPRAQVPDLSPAFLYGQAQGLAEAIDQTYGRAVLTAPDPTAWWRLVVSTGGWSENEDAIRAVDPWWHAVTHWATVRGGLHVWAWGAVPEDVGGSLGPV